MLPETAREAQAGQALIQINDEFEAKYAPEIKECDVGANGFQFNVRVEGEELTIWDKVLEGVAIEVIAVREVVRPVGVGVVRGKDFDVPAGFGDAVEFCDEGRRVWDVFDDVIAYDFIEFVVGERIGHDA